MRMNTSSMCQVSPGLGRRRRIFRATSPPNFRHHRRMLSWVTLVTSNLPFDEWAEILGSERLTGALLDRLTHHVHILEMNGESYRLAQSKRRRRSAAPPSEPQMPPSK